MKRLSYLAISACVTVLTFATPLQAFANASAQAITTKVEADDRNSMTIDEAVEELSQYINQDSNGKLYFDIEQAKSDGANAQTLERGNEFNTYADSMQNYDADDERSVNGIPIYGNWCGPGHSGPAAPIDILDTACKNHDTCYDWYGYFNCYCDDQLIAEINRNYNRMKSGKEQDTAVVVRTYFSFSPCFK